jgi:hypothetical protein
MGSLQSVTADVQKDLDAMFASVSVFRPVGIVLNGLGSIQFAQSPPDGKVYVLWGKSGEVPKFIEIGSVQGGKFSGARDAVAPYPQGSPVFIRVSK